MSATLLDTPAGQPVPPAEPAALSFDNFPVSFGTDDVIDGLRDQAGAHVDSLYVSNVGLDREQAERFVAAVRGLASLRRLCVNQTTLGPAQAGALAGLLSVPGLHTFRLTYCNIGASGLRSFLDGVPERVPGLRTLSLAGNLLNSLDLPALAALGRHLPGVTSVDLTGNTFQPRPGSRCAPSVCLVEKKPWEKLEALAEHQLKDISRLGAPERRMRLRHRPY